MQVKIPRVKLKKKKKLTDEERMTRAEKLLTVQLADYIMYMGRPWRIIWTNVLLGVSRGVGLTLGFAIVIIITIKILSLLISWKFPWLSDMSQELLEVIKTTPGLEKFSTVIDKTMETHQTGADMLPVVPAEEIQVPQVPMPQLESVKDR